MSGPQWRDAGNVASTHSYEGPVLASRFKRQARDAPGDQRLTEHTPGHQQAKNFTQTTVPADLFKG